MSHRKQNREVDCLKFLGHGEVSLQRGLKLSRVGEGLVAIIDYAILRA